MCANDILNLVNVTVFLKIKKATPQCGNGFLLS
jgi:hypothetical protein